MKEAQLCNPITYGTKRKKIIVLDCQSCANCEKNFHKLDIDNVNNGFCLRFKENTPLKQINASCWSSVSNNYYKNLYLSDEKNLKIDERLLIAKTKNLNLDLNNQYSIF